VIIYTQQKVRFTLLEIIRQDCYELILFFYKMQCSIDKHCNTAKQRWLINTVDFVYKMIIIRINRICHNFILGSTWPRFRTGLYPCAQDTRANGPKKKKTLYLGLGELPKLQLQPSATPLPSLLSPYSPPPLCSTSL
jgi:hypothetical protein